MLLNTSMGHNDNRGIFQFSNVFGNMAAYFVLNHLSSALLFAIFTSVGAFGVALLLLIRTIDKNKPLEGDVLEIKVT